MKKVSIILPVYNAEKTIKQCLQSIVEQTLQEIEVIIINDGSKDYSLSILEKYQKEYAEKITIKTIPNGGVANARNTALQLATGEYIGFVDSDDYLEKNMYEKLYQEAKKQNADIAVCGYFIQKEEEIKPYQLGNKEQYGKNISENPELFLHSVPYLWNKIFKRELIVKNQKTFHKELRIFEDLEFTYTLFLKANKIVKVDEPFYYYVKTKNSLTDGFSEKFLDIIPAIQILKKEFQEAPNANQLEEYLLYITLNHIYIRCRKKIHFKTLFLKLKYINQVFQFLDTEFPKWREHQLYFFHQEKNKKKYISKSYWKIKSILQILKS